MRLGLENLLDVAESVLHSALARRESRGAHQRTDFPERDDQDYLAHSLAYATAEVPRIDYLPVTITRWPAGERVYGRAVSDTHKPVGGAAAPEKGGE